MLLSLREAQLASSGRCPGSHTRNGHLTPLVSGAAFEKCWLVTESAPSHVGTHHISSTAMSLEVSLWGPSGRRAKSGVVFPVNSGGDRCSPSFPSRLTDANRRDTQCLLETAHRLRGANRCNCCQEVRFRLSWKGNTTSSGSTRLHRGLRDTRLKHEFEFYHCF